MQKKIGFRVLVIGGGRWGQITYNNLSSLDVSQNIALTYLYCSDNNLLTNLDLRNGNNINLLEVEEAVANQVQYRGWSGACKVKL